MSRLRRPSALLLSSALVLGAMTAPTAAFGDATSKTTITVDDVLTALVEARTATKAAATDGWDDHVDDVQLGGATSTAELAYDATDGRGSLSGQDDGETFQMIMVDHGGSYESIASYRGRGSAERYRRALTMIGHPDATWVHEPAAPDVANQDFGAAFGPSYILEVLTNSEESKISGTPTVSTAADGSSTYSLTVMLTDLGDHGSMTLTVGTDGVLTADSSDFDGEQSSSRYTYGPQAVPLPDPSDAVSAHDLDRALTLLDMRSDARMIAGEVRIYAIKNRHPHLSNAQTIRRYAKSDARMMNGMYGGTVFAEHDIARGARITATNPFTHAKVVFTVRATGKRVVVRRG